MPNLDDLKWARDGSLRPVAGKSRRKTPPHAAGSDTSRAAAESMVTARGAIERSILLILEEKGVYGLTCDEAEVMLGGRHQSVSPRFNELAYDYVPAKIKDSGRRRPTRSGRLAVVWVLR